MDYTKHFSPKKTAQTEAIPGRTDMVKNRAGGYGFKLDSWAQLDRFLILGSEGGTYYASEKEMTVENSTNLVACIKEDGVRVVNKIVDVSLGGKAPKNDPAIYALALVTTFGDDKAKAAAYQAITKVCRIGTHIFTFTDAVNKLRGWSSGLRNGVSKFYENRTADQLANQVIKYQQRNGWSHFDVLRLAHPSIKDPVGNGILRYAARKEVAEEVLHPQIKAFEAIKGMKSVKPAIKLIKDFKLPRECVPTELLGNKEVWEALLEDMPMTAMVRNLGKMSAVGLLSSNLDEATKKVVAQLKDVEALKRSRIHPVNILIARKIYEQGRGDKGSLSWSPVSKIVDALDEAFYASFGLVEPTGKNFLLGIDVSGSMGWSVAGNTPLMACEVAAAMAMVTARTEENYEIMGFASSFVNLGISPKLSLAETMGKVQRSNFGSTDVAKAIEYATKKKLPVDVFSIYTDNETYGGTQHVVQALNEYRQKLGRDAKVIFCATSVTDFTLADPNDGGMLDICGFSTDVPHVISSFAKGIEA